MSAESYAELQKWYAKMHGTPELALALKARDTMPEDLVKKWRDAAPGDDENERELALVFALTQLVDKVDLVVELSKMLASKPKMQAASHVDVSPKRIGELDEPGHDLVEETQPNDPASLKKSKKR